MLSAVALDVAELLFLTFEFTVRGNMSLHLGGLWLLCLGLGLGGRGGRALCSRAGLGWGCGRVLDLILGLEEVGIGRHSLYGWFWLPGTLHGVRCALDVVDIVVTYLIWGLLV